MRGQCRGVCCSRWYAAHKQDEPAEHPSHQAGQGGECASLALWQSRAVRTCLMAGMFWRIMVMIKRGAEKTKASRNLRSQNLRQQWNG